MTDRPRPSRRAAREATEAAMLATATRMLLESASADILSTLRPVEIARNSDPPRTTGAFYNIWPTQEDFRRAVLDQVLSEERFGTERAALETLDQVFDAERPPDVGELVRVTGNETFDALKRNPTMRLQHALWTQAHADPDVRERLRQLYVEISHTVVPRYTELLAYGRRRVVPPFTVEMLAVALTALADGLHLRWAVDPDAVPGDLGPPPGAASDDGRWSAFAALAHVLLRGMTEPLPE